MAEAFSFRQYPHVVYCDPKKPKSRPILINMHDRQIPDIRLKLKEKKVRWDFLTCLKPPEALSIESGTIYQIEDLSAVSPDYEYV